MKEDICYGVIGAGRAAELHLNALDRYAGLTVRRKIIMAPREEQVKPMSERYRFEIWSTDVEEVLQDEELDVIDICTPPYVHDNLIRRILESGKHVICEKPLYGYFGREGDQTPIGCGVQKSVMYERLNQSLDELRDVVEKSGKQFMYAENFIYAPAIEKAREIVQTKRSKILFMKGEESLKGSSSKVAGEWDKTGGGTFIRTGAHPLSAILWLKKKEAEARGEMIAVRSVLADMAQITPQLSEYEHRHIAACPNDVEDFGTAIIEFSDKTRAVVMATDTLLGGSKNYVELYCNDATIYCKLTLADLMATYFLDEDRIEDVYISEMLPSKLGWNHPFVEDEFIRGYTGEMKDFMECVYYNRKPKSDFMLGYYSAKVIYAAYMSAELGKRVELDNMIL